MLVQEKFVGVWMILTVRTDKHSTPTLVTRGEGKNIPNVINIEPGKTYITLISWYM